MKYTQKEMKNILTQSFKRAVFFEKTCQKLDGSPQLVLHWMEHLMSILNNTSNIQDFILPEDFANLLHFIINGVVSENVGKNILKEMIKTGENAQKIIENKNLMQISDSQKLNTIINNVIKENPKVVQEIESGKKKAIGFLIGQVMQKTDGRANPQIVNEILSSKWNEG
jgi:Asp-tRNA(Asn)/Glu-tRNA(Gln) amidotransferase B subunit